MQNVESESTSSCQEDSKQYKEISLLKVPSVPEKFSSIHQSNLRDLDFVEQEEIDVAVTASVTATPYFENSNSVKFEIKKIAGLHHHFMTDSSESDEDSVSEVSALITFLC